MPNHWAISPTGKRKWKKWSRSIKRYCSNMDQTLGERTNGPLHYIQIAKISSLHILKRQPAWNAGGRSTESPTITFMPAHWRQHLAYITRRTGRRFALAAALITTFGRFGTGP